MPSVYTTPTSWSGTRRSFPDKTRRRILRRAGYVCQIRGPRCIGHATIADHITAHPEARRLGWTVRQYHHEANGQAACKPCHDDKTKTEQEQGRARRSRRRPAQRHPGLLSE